MIKAERVLSPGGAYFNTKGIKSFSCSSSVFVTGRVAGMGCPTFVADHAWVFSPNMMIQIMPNCCDKLIK